MPQPIHYKSDLDQRLGLRLKLIRLKRGASQKSVADALGVTFQQIQKYERGTTRLSASALIRIAERLDTDISEFFVDFESRPGHGNKEGRN